MAAFDWLTFFRRNRIEYVEQGPNVSRGNVNISCPFCGDDPSHHMGVSLSGKGWGCWRVKSHRGTSVARLIQQLLRCSLDEARRIAGSDTAPAVSNEDFASRLKALFSSDDEQEQRRTLTFTKDLLPIRDKGSGRYFVDYLEGRGFPRRLIPELVHDYGLRYATNGPFRHRVVIPIYMPDAGLVNWTGRAIGEATVRYKTLTTDPEKAASQRLPVAVRAVDETLFNYAELSQTRARRLAIVEGPLDALKSDFFARDHGTRATCTFGKNISDAQIALLAELKPFYDEMWLVQDPDASIDAMISQARLSFLGITSRRLDIDVDDPGAMTRRQVVSFFCK